MKVKKGICVFDLHYPHHHKKLWDNILSVIDDFEPDVFLFGGDNMNFDSVDHWKQESGLKRPMENKRLKKEYTGFQSDILDDLEKRLPKKADRIFMRGNHENWVERYIDKFPEVEGLLEIENNIKIDKWADIPYGNVHKEGKLHFHHGEYLSKYSAAKTVDVYNRSIVYGHGHTCQLYTKIAPIDCESHMAVQIPCACKMNPDFMKNRPNTWLNGFGIFYIWPNGNFNLYPVIAPSGKFTAPWGKYYE